MNEFQTALDRERSWSKHLQTLDTGSYREDPETAAVLASQIRKLYRELADQLLAHERAGYKPPQES